MIDEKLLIQFLDNQSMKIKCDFIRKQIPKDVYQKKYGHIYDEIKEFINILKNKKPENELIELKVKDKTNGLIHVIGEDEHDCLLVENGKVKYYNLQNSESSEDYSDYEFVEKRLFDDYDLG